MGSVLLEASMSLDGYIAGPDISLEHPLGRGGERLHEWIFTDDSDRAVPASGTTPVGIDAEVMDETAERLGAVVIGRRMYDVGVELWGDVPFPVPSFVLTHEALPPRVEKSGTFTFVTDGAASAIEQAQAAAGDRAVLVMGGAECAQECLRTGLVDEIQVHIIPVLLGSGSRFFGELPSSLELRRTRVLESPLVTHLSYSVVK